MSFMRILSVMRSCGIQNLAARSATISDADSMESAISSPQTALLRLWYSGVVQLDLNKVAIVLVGNQAKRSVNRLLTAADSGTGPVFIDIAFVGLMAQSDGATMWSSMPPNAWEKSDATMCKNLGCCGRTVFHISSAFA